MPRKRAAYFQLRSDTFGRPFDDGIARALDAAGYDLDVCAPPDIAFRRSWLTRELFRSKWRSYDLFLGNPDLGTAFAATLARTALRPFVNAVDEVYVGGYEGEARSHWKWVARSAARRARFTIITDLCRAGLQRQYAGLPSAHRFMQYPSCYPDPYAGPSRDEARARLGLDPKELVVSVTGALTDSNGVHWLFDALDSFDGRLLIQPGNRPDAVLETLVRRLERERRVVYLPERLGWREAAQRTIAADVAVVFYLSPKPQFQQMGVSSQKLGMSLWLGIPVVATRQPSFEFISEFGCGELIGGPEELPAAIERIRADRARYAAGARRAVDEYIRPGERLLALTEAFATLSS